MIAVITGPGCAARLHGIPGPEPRNVEHEFDQLVRERRLARTEHGDLD